ncbi:uncharacterized protein LOC127845004 [Dreissena polymorpha]|uniref:Uncharacterized protein n=1 Tax=Dreissena polymorpha TaxID=45954 RepID=A0A9D4DWX8_DREPO|nr:uncharacterized protein LOC127845004 [Dreissena polymorpha]KAH3768431.1 hypothetical protein DPMN_169643 [Dreissena polymorpha]
MDKTLFGFFIMYTCTGTVLCGEYCFTAISPVEYCPKLCCDQSYSYYDYCCTSQEFNYSYIAPIVIGAVIFIAVIVTVCVCCCVKSANGMTRYQSWSTRRVGGTAIAVAVNQQSAMNNLYYPNQQYQQAYPMYQQPYPTGQQPYPTGQQPYGLGPQFGVPQAPMHAGPHPAIQPGVAQPAYPPPSSISHFQGP